MTASDNWFPRHRITVAHYRMAAVGLLARHSNGETYTSTTLIRSGTIELAALAEVSIDLSGLSGL